MSSDEKNISDIFLSYKHVISSLLSRITFTPAQEIEDILQETFVRVYQSALKQEIRFPKAFMVKTALRIANHQRHNNKIDYVEAIEDFSSKGVILGNNAPKGGSLDVDYIKQERFEVLCQAINELPVKCRKVLILKKVYGLSQKEIAKRLEISESTVEKHVAKGILKCNQFLTEKEKRNDHSEASKKAASEKNDVYAGKKS